MLAAACLRSNHARHAPRTRPSAIAIGCCRAISTPSKDQTARIAIGEWPERHDRVQGTERPETWPQRAPERIGIAARDPLEDIGC